MKTQIIVILILSLLVFTLLYLLSIFIRYQIRIHTILTKYKEYKETKRAVLCFVDDEFDFKSNVFRYIELNDGKFIIRGKTYSIDEVVDMRYNIRYFGMPPRSEVLVCIIHKIIKDVYNVDSAYIRNNYPISLVVIVHALKNNIELDKEKVKELLKTLKDKTIKP